MGHRQEFGIRDVSKPPVRGGARTPADCLPYGFAVAIRLYCCRTAVFCHTALILPYGFDWCHTALSVAIRLCCCRTALCFCHTALLILPYGFECCHAAVIANQSGCHYAMAIRLWRGGMLEMAHLGWAKCLQVQILQSLRSVVPAWPVVPCHATALSVQQVFASARESAHHV